ncbi:hypothetical protein KOI35_23810 [Actinoplanes bogorensis]|uniref:Uncharacterized protein n=1 Tax=Paractinoplanes bogorensis TaxID=1610840 RepID=A0ABS5YSW5_9ACTN|nr:hypothetical protein [Actinoplanes bogorensis]MBU2666538.1 hypothetical protein [Actinoplanes bogorensis]
MSISGLGNARPLPPPVRPARAAKPDTERDDDYLTGRDRELIFQVTGQRDPLKQSATAFAAILSAERAAGRLAPGQEATALYLKDLNRRYERTGGPNPVAGLLPKALGYLQEGGSGRIDVSA